METAKVKKVETISRLRQDKEHKKLGQVSTKTTVCHSERSLQKQPNSSLFENSIKGLIIEF